MDAGGGGNAGGSHQEHGLTCPSCRITIVPPRTRSMCPFCGSFYDQAANDDVSLRGGSRNPGDPVRLPQIPDSQRQVVRLAGFTPVLNDGLGLIQTYITGIVMGSNRRGSNGNNNTTGRSHQNSGENVPASTTTTTHAPTDTTARPPTRLEVVNRNQPAGANANNNVQANYYLSLPPINPNEAGQGLTTHTRDGTSPDTRPASKDFRQPPAESLTDGMEPILYPTKDLTVPKFKEELETAKASGDYSLLQELYEITFGSVVDLKDPNQEGARLDDPDLKMDLIHTVYDALDDLPSYVTKALLKALVNALLSPVNNRLRVKDETRAVYILVQNPVFNSQASYSIFAHLLRKTVSLSSGDHQLLIHWFARLEGQRLRALVKCLLQFITIREFPPANGQKLPSIGKSRWWIPCATRLLALLNAANNRSNVISYTEFYNSALDHINLMAEYYRWQNPSKNSKFSYCQYPFILSIVAKKSILQRDSEQQMILNARRSLLNRALFRQIPDIDVFFLNLNVRRSHLVSDSLNEIASKQCDLKKKLKVTFVGEPGLDMGGLTKEWFLLVIRQIFDSNYGMFVYHNKARCYWFSTSQNGNLREYNLIGVLMGLAVYNSIILDLHFPRLCYRKLLSPPVVPQHLETASSVGLCKFTMEDFAEVMPDVAVGLRELLAYEGNVEEDFCMNFQVSVEEFGAVKTHILQPGGENKPVNNQNRQEYVDLYMDLILNKAIYQSFKAFYLGFHSVCASNALIMLRPEEVEMLVCGNPTLDMEELQKVTTYDGFIENEPIMKEFWEIVKSFSNDLQKQFLRFTTGSDRVPVGGMGEMTFKISALNHTTEMLPVSHTCFNQLVLPRYKNRDIMREKLVIAISNAEGFGLE